MQKYQNAIQDVNGNAVAGATVAVYLYGTTTPATIYSDNGVTPIVGNSVTTSSVGEFFFYAANGRYSLTVTAVHFTSDAYNDITLFDPTDDGAAAINFLQAGTGAVVRTVQAKERDTVSVKDFGAVGDGVTDDTAAFAAAYAFVATGAEILVPYAGASYNISTVSGSKYVRWHCDFDLSGNLALLALPGVVFSAIAGANAIWQNASTSSDYSTFRLNRVANHTGGTPGNVASAFRVATAVSAGVANYEWAIVGVVNNSATAGENVAIYGQGNRLSTGPTWGIVAEARDTTGSANPTTGLVGIEVDVFANGTDTSLRRVGVDVVVGKGNSGGAAAVAGYGLRIGPFNNDATAGSFTNGIALRKTMTTAIDIGTQGNVGILFGAAVTHVVGVDFSAASFSENAIRLGRTQSIALEATNTLKLESVGASDSVVKFKNGATERIGFDVSATPAIRVNSIQVVSARATGWAAMTGTANIATSYDTSTVTLAQLAGRVLSLQAALTTHGLIGT